jgi:antitoxin component YwqK of YwqJK toxin-antitoxin module
MWNQYIFISVCKFFTVREYSQTLGQISRVDYRKYCITEYPNGEVKQEAGNHYSYKLSYKQGRLHGLCEFYYWNIKVESCMFKNNKRHGNCKKYHYRDTRPRYATSADAKWMAFDYPLWQDFNYKNGFLYGMCKEYDTKGKLIRENITIRDEYRFYYSGEKIY